MVEDCFVQQGKDGSIHTTKNAISTTGGSLVAFWSSRLCIIERLLQINLAVI